MKYKKTTLKIVVEAPRSISAARIAKLVNLIIGNGCEFLRSWDFGHDSQCRALADLDIGDAKPMGAQVDIEEKK